VLGAPVPHPTSAIIMTTMVIIPSFVKVLITILLTLLEQFLKNSLIINKRGGKCIERVGNFLWETRVILRRRPGGFPVPRPSAERKFWGQPNIKDGLKNNH